jgi:predicted nucleotide-binding protein
MKVFIGSSSESLEEVRMVAEWIEEESHEPIPWNKSGVFPLGHSMLESLRELARTVDAAILIFSEDDPISYRGDIALQPRDNVLIEYGLFAMELGPKKVIICRKGVPRIASDLKGLIFCNLDKRYKAQNSIIQWLKTFDT